MTKYVLNSGGVGRYPELARKFFGEVFKDLGPSPKLLICCFAQPREDWEAKFAADVQRRELFPESVAPQLELAFPETFREQIEANDVVYLHGGDDHLIQYWLSQFEDLPKLWEGKVVATNSASSNALAAHFWTCDWRKNLDGLGILPIKFISHYQSDYGFDDPRGPIDWEQAYQELETYRDISLPIHALKEGEYVVIEE